MQHAHSGSTTAVASNTNPNLSLSVTSTYYLHQLVTAGIDVVGGLVLLPLVVSELTGL